MSDKGFIVICGSCGRQNTFKEDHWPMKNRDHWQKENIQITVSDVGALSVEFECVCKNHTYYEKD